MNTIIKNKDNIVGESYQRITGKLLGLGQTDKKVLWPSG